MVELFDFLVQREARIDLVNLYGHTVIHTVAAKSNDNVPLVKYIFEKSNTIIDPFISSVLSVKRNKKCLNLFTQ